MELVKREAHDLTEEIERVIQNLVPNADVTICSFPIKIESRVVLVCF